MNNRNSSSSICNTHMGVSDQISYHSAARASHNLSLSPVWYDPVLWIIQTAQDAPCFLLCSHLSPKSCPALPGINKPDPTRVLCYLGIVRTYACLMPTTAMELHLIGALDKISHAKKLTDDACRTKIQLHPTPHLSSKANHALVVHPLTIAVLSFKHFEYVDVQHQVITVLSIFQEKSHIAAHSHNSTKWPPTPVRILVD